MPDPIPNKFFLLQKWQEKVTEIATHAHLIAEERQLRQDVFAAFFPTPGEGTNTAELNEGWKLQGKLKIDRKIDEAALEAVKEVVRKMGFNPDPLIRNKPELVLKDYKALPDEVKKVFDTALTIKPALPTIELVPPKEKK